MPTTRVAPDLDMHYLIDDYTDPWREKETVLLLHGAAESGRVWFGWVPHLARHFRVVRPDLRGFADSTPMARDFAWSVDVFVDDCLGLMSSLGIERVHLVGAKLGGTIARRFAARCPDKVSTLTLVGAPPPYRDMVATVRTWIEEFDKYGIEHWARRTMAGRLGSRLPAEGAEWWIKLMGRTPVSTYVGFVSNIPTSDITADLPNIKCQTLVITTDASALGSVEETRAWQQKIPRSTLLVLPGDSFHVAATDPDRCARETLDFIKQQNI